MYIHSSRSIRMNVNPVALESPNIARANTIVHEVMHGFIHNDIDTAFPTNTNVNFQSSGGTYTSTTDPKLQDRIRAYHTAYQTYSNFADVALAHHNIIANNFLEDLTKANMQYTNTKYSFQLSKPFRAIAYTGLHESAKYLAILPATKKELRDAADDLIDKLKIRPITGSMSDKCR